MKKAILFAFAPLLAACDAEPTTSDGLELRDREEATPQSAPLVEPVVVVVVALPGGGERVPAELVVEVRPEVGGELGVLRRRLGGGGTWHE